MTSAIWFGANDRLSRCASVLSELIEAAGVGLDDMRALGTPGEWMPMIEGNWRFAAVGVLADHGYTPASFTRELEDRTCARFVRHEIGRTLVDVVGDVPGPEQQSVEREYVVTVSYLADDGVVRELDTIAVKSASWCEAGERAQALYRADPRAIECPISSYVKAGEETGHERG
jgi:hypothetical protein